MACEDYGESLTVGEEVAMQRCRTKSYSGQSKFSEEHKVGTMHCSQIRLKKWPNREQIALNANSTALGCLKV